MPTPSSPSERSGKDLPIRVVVGEDSYLAREGIRRVLERAPAINVVAICTDLDDLRSAVENNEPDVVLTEVRMPPDYNDEGIVLAGELRSTHPEIGVILLSQYADPVFVHTLCEQGCRRRAYLLKERLANRKELTGAIQTVVEGGSVLDPLIVTQLVRARRNHPPDVAKLTEREFEVLGLIAQGQSNAAIARSLVLSKRGVERHINSIFAKLDLGDPKDVSRRVKAALLYLSSDAHAELPLAS
jgi:DNA-binding NarL/FixJ family response regulator